MSTAEADMLHVFIADDSQPVAEMLTQFLAAPGHIEIVGVGATAGATLESIRAVRAEPELDGTRLLVTSNHDSPQLRAGCLELGANGYFDKVKELAALSERVVQLAEEKRRLAKGA